MPIDIHKQLSDRLERLEQQMGLWAQLYHAYDNRLDRAERKIMALSEAEQAVNRRLNTITNKWAERDRKSAELLRLASVRIAELETQVGAGGLPASEEGVSATDEAAQRQEFVDSLNVQADAMETQADAQTAAFSDPAAPLQGVNEANK